MGVNFSSQVLSNSEEANFWLIIRFIFGISRWVTWGKYPSILENFMYFEVVLNLKYSDILLSSMAIINPEIVTINAASLINHGMVICWMLVGFMLLVIKNPAKMLPISSRLIELFRVGIFSLIGDIGRKRGWPIRAKKMMRVL